MIDDAYQFFRLFLAGLVVAIIPVSTVLVTSG